MKAGAVGSHRKLPLIGNTRRVAGQASQRTMGADWAQPTKGVKANLGQPKDQLSQPGTSSKGPQNISQQPRVKEVTSRDSR